MNKKVKIVMVAISLLEILFLANCDDGKEDSTIQNLLLNNILISQPNDLLVAVQGNCATCANFDIRIYEGSSCSGSAIRSQISIAPSNANYYFYDLPGGVTYSIEYSDGTNTDCNHFFVNGSGKDSYCYIMFSSTTYSGLSCVNI